MYKLIHISLAILLSGALRAQSKLDEYVLKGLTQNEAIKQQNFELEISLNALNEARSLFLPRITFNGNYTLAKGGRTIDFPVGDLLNPVYNTLNQLTNSGKFSEQQNRSILLNPNNFYDVKFRTSYPIINPELKYNERIKSQQADIQKLEVVVFKRDLVKEIKVAYYQFQKATVAIRLYESARILVNENLRINQSLSVNDRANGATLLRSQNEVTKINAQLEVAVQEQHSAKAYFNFLINEPLKSEVLLDSVPIAPLPDEQKLRSATNREELQQLRVTSLINTNLIGLSNSYKIPKLNLFLDLGSQGFEFMVNSKSAYYLAGVSLEWNVFAGNKNRYKVKQAEASLKNSESKSAYASQQLALQLETAANQLDAAVTNYLAAKAQINSSEKYYKDALKLYKEGSVLFIELLDAQNQLVSARLQTNISLFDALIRQVEIERLSDAIIP